MSNEDNKLEKIRHSLSHLLAAAVLKKIPETKLGIGPTIENGFYYDFLFPKGKGISENDLPELEGEIKNLIRLKLPFSGKRAATAEAKKLFKNQPFKLDLIKEFVKEKQKLSVYKTGEIFIDLCRGGHIKNTKEINPDAFKLTKIAGAYWRGSEKNPMLTRIYGVAFATKKELGDYLKLLEVAERCDHRVLGERLEYFMVDAEIGKGLPLWLPNGHFIRRQLENYMYEVGNKKNE